MVTDPNSAEARQPGVGQGITVITAGFLPILAIVSLFPAVPSIIDHFSGNPSAAWQVPAMVSAPGLTIAVIALFAGMLVDRFGRRKLMLGSLLLYGLFGAAPFFLDDLNAIYASRLLLGVAEAAILTTLNTLIGDYWEDAGRRKWLTLQGLAGPFLASGVILASGYLTGLRWNGIFLIYLIAFPIFFAAARYLYEPASDATARKMLGIGQGPARTPFPMASVVMIGIVTLFSSALYYVFIINGGMAFREVGIMSSQELGKLTFIPSLFVMVGSLIFWATGRLGPVTQLGIFLAMIGGGLAWIGLASDWRWMIAGLVIQQTGAGMAVPTLIAWAQTKLPFEHRGRGMGLWTACFFFGQFSSPFLVSLFRAQTGAMQSAFLIMGATGVAGAIAAFVFAASRRGGGIPAAARAA
ncbi:MFS transporter [Sphingomonas arantia]|uniref:MFS transporter n=1 Tax=Sphingomonas arantia TaxID=1460676 RepID=A0ABW4TXS3_9SPHN